MEIKYLGKRDELELVPPLVEETVKFTKKNKMIATVTRRDGEKLIADNPRTFKEVPVVIPETLDEKFLKKLDPREIEAIVLERFGEDLDLRHEKSDLIKEALEIQKERADEAEKAESDAKKKAAAEKKKAEKAAVKKQDAE